MNYATEKTLTPKWGGGDFTVKLKMVSVRDKLGCVDSEGDFDTLKYFEAAVPEVTGLSVNDTEIKDGKDILDTPGFEPLFAEIMAELRTWDISETDQKNS